MSSTPETRDWQQHEELLNEDEVAEILGLKPQTLAKWRMTKKHLPWFVIGGSIRYKPSDIQNYIERQRHAAAPERDDPRTPTSTLRQSPLEP